MLNLAINIGFWYLLVGFMFTVIIIIAGIFEPAVRISFLEMLITAFTWPWGLYHFIKGFFRK